MEIIAKAMAKPYEDFRNKILKECNMTCSDTILLQDELSIVYDLFSNDLNEKEFIELIKLFYKFYLIGKNNKEK